MNHWIIPCKNPPPLIAVSESGSEVGLELAAMLGIILGAELAVELGATLSSVLGVELGLELEGGGGGMSGTISSTILVMASVRPAANGQMRASPGITSIVPSPSQSKPSSPATAPVPTASSDMACKTALPALEAYGVTIEGGTRERGDGIFARSTLTIPTMRTASEPKT